jgi:2,4-dienoyl-CoA reductase-like NADH-dependent reductase (Old Yellow Enzyme family)/thioredoxin reductase
MPHLEHLFSPVRINHLELANRAVMPPMGTELAKDHMVNDALLAYTRRQAAGGVGLYITEVTAVHPSGISGKRHLGAFDDRFIPGLATLAEAIHEAGGKAALQLHHTGRESGYLLHKGEAIGPSALPSKVFRKAPREMTVEEIREIVVSFGEAARRAQQAGFDAVEIHGAHGYLLTQFLSALSNQREDDYGGTFQARSRFVVEVVAEVRRSVGADFPVILRLSAEEHIKGGYTVEDVQTILPALVRAGVDAIHASIGTHGSPGSPTSAPPEREPGWNVGRARKLKEVVNLPVIAVGRFTDPALADDVIARGDADLVAFGRQQLADPDFLLKAREGRTEDIRECIGCNQGCIERLMLEPGTSVRCAINPETGQELIYPRVPAAKAKKVWVVGAGPAGLTAAYEAKRLGHDVTVFEKENAAGGQMFVASRSPYKDVYWQWISWLASQVEKAGVPVQAGNRVTAATIDQDRPEVVILASGGEKIIPAIPGADLPLTCNAWQVLGGTVVPGKNVAVVGGGPIGMEVADFLLDKGSSVTLVEMLERSPVPTFAAHGYWIHKRLRDGGCRFHYGATVESIEDGSVTVRTGEKRVSLSPVDQVVLAVGMRPRDDLKESLQESGIPYHVVGDANEVRRIQEATEEGAKAAWEI